jgi:alkylated DNA repair protein (DNA oxidative demethylase)
MIDLFDVPVLPGLKSKSDIVTTAEAFDLITAIDAEGLSPFKFQQWTGKRMTRSFGWKVDYQTGALELGDPIPGWLQPLRDRAARFAGIDPAEVAQALLIRYDPGAGIGWHRDRPAYGQVIGVSLGAPATMRLRLRDGKRFLRTTFPLEPQGAYYLGGAARWDWEHSIAELGRTRHSITFRTLAR